MARLSDINDPAVANGSEPLLPWTQGQEDRLFRRMVILFLLLFLAAGFIANRISLPEPPQKKLVEVAPRLARLIQEKKQQPPPPPKPKPKPKPKKKEPEKKKPEPKKKKPEPKKSAAKPRPKPKAKPKPVDRRVAARAKARQSGLIALQDDLADLRDSITTADLSVTPQRTTAKPAETLVASSDAIVRDAVTGSGGIRSGSASRKIQGSKLAQRKTTSVSSRIDSAGHRSAIPASKRNARGATRGQDEIEQVFQMNKGAIFRIYNRALRKDPALQGKVVVELTIAPNGTVTRARIISSELNNPKLEKRLLSKIRKFRFKAKKVPTITVTYPIEFLPS